MSCFLRHIERRRFLKVCVAAAAAPCIIPGSALGLNGTPAPSERIAMGLIGCGDHGTGWNLDRMFANEDQQVVAVCDVDSRHLANAAKKVNKHYTAKLAQPYHVEIFSDFRDLVNRKKIDAIDVATPDHWHALPALMGLKTGKHVICEKPLTLTVQEGRILSDVAKNSGLVFQTASENRSVESYIRMVELVRAGVFGQIKHVKILLPPSNRHRQVLNTVLETPPPELNYEMWQGQAPVMPYCASRVHFNFRWNLAYSGGIITDWGAHMIDLAHWATGQELTGPLEVEGKGDFPPREAIRPPDNMHVTGTIQPKGIARALAEQSGRSGGWNHRRVHLQQTVARAYRGQYRMLGQHGPRTNVAQTRHGGPGRTQHFESF